MSQTTLDDASRKVLLAVVGVVVCLLALYGAFFFWLDSSGHPMRDPRRRVTSFVEGGGQASLTYRNQSGGTEQRKVDLPWDMEMKRLAGEFVYLSAQMQEQGGFIRAAIYIDGQALQEAKSDKDFGVATVSGVVP